MKVCVLGLGYVGLPTAAIMAESGHLVVGYDTEASLITALLDGTFTIKEPAVRALVTRALENRLLTPSLSIPADADAYIICVPTPTVNHKPDLSYVKHATDAVAPLLVRGNILVLESTVPPNTMDRTVVRALRAAGVDPDSIAIAHCPERILPGDIVRELRNNSRVIGGRKPGDAERARELYVGFAQGAIYLTDNVTAELVKVIENTYRDVNIAFANELALLSEELGVDAQEAITLANHHPRVNILRPGPGVGGHCIPIDPHFLSNANPFVTELIQTSRRVNERMPHVVTRRILEFVPRAAGAPIAILGAAYKANVGDTRESPTAHLEELLHERGYATRIFDPIAERYEHPLSASLEDCLYGAHAVVLMVEHDIFLNLDPAVLGPFMERRILIDTRAFFDADEWERFGFQVYTLGGKRQRTVMPSSFTRAVDRRNGERRIVTTVREEYRVGARSDPAPL
jgi:UDP-N-acetyl-D-mannosaminuronic acid dehydrogenase